MAGNKKGFHQRRMATQAAPKDHDHIGLDVMYAGSAFRGLQIQTHSPTHHTLEGILLQAMVDVGMIEGLSRGAPSGSCHHFSRSCRTDRGVHAIRNVIAIFIPRERCVALGGVEGIHAKLNKALPSAVRVATVFMLTGGFIPRHCCNRRVYRYLLPAYALMPPADSWAAMLEAYPDLPKALMPLAHQRSQQWASEAEDPRRCGIALTESDASWGPQLLPWVHALRQSVERCNDVLRTFVVGAHRFHNFSVDARELSNGAKVVHPDSDEALRVIHRCEVVGRVWMLPVARHGPSLVEYSANKSVDGAPPGLASFTAPPSVPAELDHLPFLMMQIEGNSFLFNMIRKVVGSMLAVCRGARPALLEEALSPERRVLTPLAPGGYLYLAQSTYHGYDRTVLGMRNERFRTLQDARSGAVATAAERFAWEVIAADVVDLDVHQLPPLDFMLAARDAAQKVRRPQSEKEDAHLATMKEYRPISLEKVATTACSDMTIFLRLLRVHNWGITTINLAPNSKALLEAKNVERRRAAAAEAEADDTQQAAPVEAVADSVNREMPEGGADGWVYVGASVAEEEAMCEAFFRARWKRSRPWEHTTASADDSCAPATSAAKGE